MLSPDWAGGLILVDECHLSANDAQLVMGVRGRCWH